MQIKKTLMRNSRNIKNRKHAPKDSRYCNLNIKILLTFFKEIEDKTQNVGRKHDILKSDTTDLKGTNINSRTTNTIKKLRTHWIC